MLLDVILVSFLVAFFRGGRITEYPRFKNIWMLGVSILLQLSTLLIPKGAPVLVSMGYLFTLLFLMSNKKFEDVRIFMIGWLLNACVIWANWGRMPVDIEQVKRASLPLAPLVSESDWKHTVISSSTNLPFLGDIIGLRYPIPRVISIGDLFIMLGVYLVIQRIMNKPVSLANLRTGKKYEAA